MTKIRVLVVEDRPAVCHLLAKVLGQDPRLQVTATLASCAEALRCVARAAPDIIVIRWNQPGSTFIRRVSGQYATPIIALVDEDFARAEALALGQGAVSAFLSLPAPASQGFALRCKLLCDQVASMSRVRVIRRRLTDLPDPSPSFEAVGIAASTGGPAAVREVLSQLPADFPLPILVVQHITPEFSDSFVEWLDGNCPLRVQLAQHQQRTQPGTVYVAPANLHIQWKNGRTWLSEDALECWHRPSANVLFRSLAGSGVPAIGVLLTGLGEDGANGLLALFQAGGHTIAQDRASCIVYGMPQAAMRLGGASQELPLQSIGPRLLQLINPTHQMVS